jgi:hypothetical protein
VRIRPLSFAAVGIVFVAIDLRLTWGDALPDAIGWGLIAWAAHRLGMRWSAGLAAAAAVMSLAELHLPYEFESYDLVSGRVIPNPEPNSAYDERLVFLPLDGPRFALVVGSVALGGAALTLMLRELGQRAATTTDDRSTKSLRILTWAVPLGWIVPYVAIAIGSLTDHGSFDPIWNDSWELAALVAIVVALATAAVFASGSNTRWSASGDEIGSPWAEMMLRDVEQMPDS